MRIFFLILIGFIIGLLFMNLLSMKASKIYIETVRIDYLTEQEILAVHAQKKGDFNKAWGHYNNLVYATSSPGIVFFEKLGSKWSFLFPFASIILQKITDNTNFSEASRVRIEGINRGKLAIVLEKLGKKKKQKNSIK